MIRTNTQLSVLNSIGNIGKNTYDSIENSNFFENNGAKVGLLLSVIYIVGSIKSINDLKHNCDYIYKYGNVFVLQIFFIILACAIIIYFIIGTILNVDSKRLNVNIIHISFTPIYILIFLFILAAISA
jgi:hypothetical protein